MDVGSRLRAARERRNLSIEHVARATKINAALLHAIENNAFDALPAGIFTRGFIRAFAREVGLDPEETVSHFLEQTGVRIPGTTTATAELSARGHLRLTGLDVEPSGGKAAWAYTLIVGLMLIALISYTRSVGRENALPVADRLPAVQDTTRAAEDGPPEEPEDLHAAVGGGAQAVEARVQPVATDGNLLHLEIEPHGTCWVEVVADGRLVVYRLMQAGERETLDARGDVTLRVGDPSAFAFSINGTPGRSLGRPGIPVSIRLTSENYEEFLSP